MEHFKSIFGIDKSSVKKTCVLVPVLTKAIIKNFGIRDFFKSNLYACGNSEDFTLIHTLMGASFVGDAVLHLKETDCRNLILFGSCGIVRGSKFLKVGSLISPTESYSMESFSNLLLSTDKEITTSKPDNELLNKFLYSSKHAGIQTAKCASFGSLVLEEKHREYLISENIEVMDMESSAFFLASLHTGKKAVGLFYATDIMLDKPVFKSPSAEDKNIIINSSTNACMLLTEFIANL